MEIEHLINAFLSLVTIVAGGGWFISYKNKKIAETQKNKSDNVDLTDKILDKYQKTVLDSMGGHDKRHDELDQQIREIKCIQIANAEEISYISQYLNGGFVSFKKTSKTPKTDCDEKNTNK